MDFTLPFDRLGVKGALLKGNITKRWSKVTDPTTGGVLASYASLGDLILAEPGALIGFSGARVTDQTIGEKLPTEFQRSKFVLEHGFLDQIVPRSQLRDRIAFFLGSFRPVAHDLRWSL